MSILSPPGIRKSRIDIRDFGAVLDGVTDDSAAWNRAVTYANAQAAAGKRVPIYIPPGVTRIVTAPPMFLGAGALIGDGTHKSFIYVDPALSGAVFSWSEAWLSGSYPQAGNTLGISTEAAGPWVEGLTVFGDRSSTHEQNAFVMYDRVDCVMFREVEVFYMPGRAFWSGVTSAKSQSYMRESQFHNFRIYSSGNSATGAPCVELNSVGGVGTDATNEVEIRGLSIFAAYDKAVWIHNSGNGTVRLIRFFGLRIEGASAGVTGNDGLVIGDPASANAVRDISVTGFDGEMSYSGFAAVRITASSGATAPFNIYLQGSISTGSGDGISVDAGRLITIDLVGLSVSGTGIIVGPSTLVTGPVNIAARGNEGYWSYNIDATSLKWVQYPLYRTGNPQLASQATSGGGVVANFHDASAAGGSAVGTGAVDLQTIRTANTQTANAQFSTIAGGRLNQIGSSASGGMIPGGSGNVVNGIYSLAHGNSAADHGRTGTRVMADGTFSGAGEAQIVEQVMRGSVATAATFRLTADAAAAGSANVFNLVDNYGVTFTLRVHVHDQTAAGDYSWVVPNAMLTRDTGAASTLLTLGTPAIASRGTLTTVTVSATADTTNGGLNITVTPPAANTHTLHAVASLTGVEVH